MKQLTWMQKFKIGFLYGVLSVFDIAWCAGPGFLVGAILLDWNLHDWSARGWVVGGIALLVNCAWIMLSRGWLDDLLDEPLDRAVDWALR